MSGKFAKRMVVGLALMASIATTLIGGSAAASTSPAGDPQVQHNFDILFGGGAGEYLVNVYGVQNIPGGVQVTVTRGPAQDRSAIFNSWIGTTRHRDFAIDFLNYLGNPVKQYYYSDAYIAQVNTSPGGQEQSVVIDAAKMTITQG